MNHYTNKNVAQSYSKRKRQMNPTVVASCNINTAKTLLINPAVIAQSRHRK